MVEARAVGYYNHRLKGSLTELQCRQLETIMLLAKKTQPLDKLKHTICTLTNKQVKQVLEEGKDIPIEDRPEGLLTDGQTLSLAFAYIARNCLIGDSVGLGKTVEMSALINLLERNTHTKNHVFRYLFLTEKTIVPQVQSELVRFTGKSVKAGYGDKVNVNKLSKQYPKGIDGGLVASHSIISQPAFYSWLQRLQSNQSEPLFDLIIIDESSILGNVNNQIYKNAKVLKQYGRRVVLLNATPFESNLEYLYGQLSFVDSKLMPTMTEFKQTYFDYSYNINGQKTFTGKYKHSDQFKYQVAYRYFYVTRKQLGATVKNVHSEILSIPMSKVQRRLMRESSMHRMVYDSPSAIDPNVEVSLETTPKIKLVKQVVEKAGIEQGEQVLISAVYKETQKILKEYLEAEGYSVEILNGAVKKKRKSIVQNFRKNNTDILITNVQKGLNFGSVKTIIFYGYDPNPSRMLQMEGRITRSFDIENKNIYLLTTQGKEEQTISKVIAQRYAYNTKFSSQDISGIGALLLKAFKDKGTL